jgi:hypothetical protein
MDRMVEIHLYGKLRRFAAEQDPARDSVLRLPVGAGETIAEITERLGISPEELGRNIFLNGQLSALTRQLHGGDRLALFPPDMSLLYRQYFPVYE